MRTAKRHQNFADKPYTMGRKQLGLHAVAFLDFGVFQSQIRDYLDFLITQAKVTILS
jgi:hypothetical protein